MRPCDHATMHRADKQNLVPVELHYDSSFCASSTPRAFFVTGPSRSGGAVGRRLRRSHSSCHLRCSLFLWRGGSSRHSSGLATTTPTHVAHNKKLKSTEPVNATTTPITHPSVVGGVSGGFCGEGGEGGAYGGTGGAGGGGEGASNATVMILASV